LRSNRLETTERPTRSASVQRLGATVPVRRTKEPAMTRTRVVCSLAVAAAGLALLGGGPPGTSAQEREHADRCHQPGPYQLPHGGEPVDLDPADLSHRITNRYWPMRPGTTWVYRETEGADVNRVTVTVLDRTRMVRGIRARVVHDVVRRDGRVVEDTYDWYAQDSGGSVWYLGESTREYADGEPASTEGSWEYGVDGAQAGIVVPARPRPGCRYRQEHLAGEAEDRAAVLSVREDLRLSVGRFADVLSTGDYAGLEPGVVEHKFLAPGTGPVLELSVSPGAGRAVLVAMRQSPSSALRRTT
jgi:hypothetical protein